MVQHSQLDVEVSQMKRNGASNKERQNGQLPNPIQAAAASAITFTIGAMIPLVDATFIVSHEVRLAVVVAAVTAALVVFGWIGAFRGKAPGVKSCFRVLVGG
ncbi:vacuolar iron transporter homolog 4-like protein [Tanacetum coccineum]|uniref:Vacuolar iron transporter n=1 Tax=Tanacetum coccineum TaxID=301880 RepID=A0ABQ4XJJ8_9ASTR